MLLFFLVGNLALLTSPISGKFHYFSNPSLIQNVYQGKKLLTKKIYLQTKFYFPKFWVQKNLWVQKIVQPLIKK